MLFEQGGCIDISLFCRDCNFNSLIQQIVFMTFHLFSGCVFLVYWNMRSLWIPQKKRNINECNLNKQTKKQKPAPPTPPPPCTGKKLRWPCTPSSNSQINWKLNLLEMYQFSWLVLRKKKVPPLSCIWQV